MADLRSVIDAYYQRVGQINRQMRSAHLSDLVTLAEALNDLATLKRKYFTAGNGIAAFLADYMAADLVLHGRKGISISNTAVVTGIAASKGFHAGFANQLFILADEGDALIVFSFTGEEVNLNMAVQGAKKNGLLTIAFTPAASNTLSEAAHFAVAIPAVDDRQNLQAHLTAVSALMETLV